MNILVHRRGFSFASYFQLYWVDLHFQFTSARTFLTSVGADHGEENCSLPEGSQKIKSLIGLIIMLKKII